jgi:hypothetical protein
MRRERIVKAVNNLKDALHAAQIRELLRLARNSQSGEGGNRTQRILIAYNVFMQHYKEFSEDEKLLMGYFGLDPVLDINFWSNLIDGEQSISRKLLSEVDVGAYNIIFVMPKMRDLLTQENDRDTLVIADSSGAEHELKRIRVLIVEKERSLTEPSVLINVVRSMTELYDSLSSLYNTGGVSLTIGSIDSGGAKSMDFFGAMQVMEALDHLFLNVWNRVKLAGEENIRYQIEMAMMASGYTARINEALTSQLITEDQGQRMTRSVAKAMETLFRNGAYTESMDEIHDVRASQLLAPKTQLLEYREEPRSEQKRQETVETAGEAALGASALSGPALAAAAFGGAVFNDGALGGLNSGGLFDVTQPQAAPARASSGYGGQEQPFRTQTTNLRDFREPKEAVKNLKDILDASVAV